MSDTEQSGDVEALAKNQIWIKVQNDTGYDLQAQSGFADWGDVAEPPLKAREFLSYISVPPQNLGNGGHIVSSRSPFTGSAGMVGYKIVGSTTLYLRFLASNPYMSAKDNYATAAVLTEDKGIDQENYNWLYYEPADHQHYYKPFEGKTLKLRVSSQIGQADEATATFTVTLE
ncbi:hypothetical protein FCULG_00002824 [Fusarium culmorum]|uniref:Uncharacterized protein n=1 Tax=Fusarium culmorum TaxID=5516 RepID=A0A2T4H641_FUSCU|nr:hypothetical protein FCULG_00002824 [Fusarium culmorum]